jgi:glycerol-3-phosphate acyltransferase PlsX
MTGSTLNKLAAAKLRPQLREVRDQVNPENTGGSFLLGVRGSVMIGHGNSEARGVTNALLGISKTGAGLTEELENILAGDTK